MGKLSDAKIMGGIGSLLQLVPGVSIVGWILTLIAVKYVSDELKDQSVFNNMIIAVVTAIIGALAGVSIFLFGALTSLMTLGAGAIVGVLGGLAVVWIALIISSIFLRKSFNVMSTRLNVPAFKTAGTLYFIGAILVIVLVGFIVLLVAYIFQIIAFFSINEAAPMAAAQPVNVPVSGAMKFCANCGTQMPVDTAFCPKCGAKQP